MDGTSIMFYILAVIMVLSGLGVLFSRSPIYSALSLVISMITMAFMFFVLNAYFIAGVQLIVYAGAVVVLFVMVLMLFDLKEEAQTFTKNTFNVFLVIASVGLILGYIMKVTQMSTDMILSNPMNNANLAEPTTHELAITLYSEYLFAFEALGLLLLLIAVGVVAISRIKGGTHAADA